MLNKQDKKYISDTFDQKFDEKFDVSFNRSFDKKFAEMKKEMFTEIRSEMFNYMDPFLKEIQAMREEATIQLQHLSRHDDQLENYGERITHLEGNLVLAV